MQLLRMILIAGCVGIFAAGCFWVLCDIGPFLGKGWKESREIRRAAKEEAETAAAEKEAEAAAEEE